MKKHFKLLSKSFLSFVVASSTTLSTVLTLSSCVNKKDDNEDKNDNNETTNGEIKIEDQSPISNDVDSDSNLTLYVNVASSKPVKYQWYINKNNITWDLIKDATQSSYSITSDLMESVTTTTTWKYKVEIYDADDENIKLTSKVYSVNIKPKQTTPNPGPSPEPDPNPEPSPTPPNPSPSPNPKPDNPTTSINENSVKLNNIGSLLPSQYLSDINSETLDQNLITTSFDVNKIKNVTYKISELNDQFGTLKILMNYVEDNNQKAYTFDFKNLLKLDDSGYHFEFENANNILDLSAQNIASTTINSKSIFENFLKYIETYNIKFKFKFKGYELPLRYLDFNKIDITGFSDKWFTSNNKLVLSFSFENLKINYYVKTSSSNINLNNFTYPTNITKKTSMEFYSASDYLLNKIKNNNNYKTDKYAAYYYYDIMKDEAFESQTKISDNDWLSDVITRLSYNGKEYVYMPILNTSEGASVDNGSLTINLKMEYQDNSSNNVTSQRTSSVTITGFASYDQNNLFSNSNNVDNKFSLWCDPINYDKNIEKLKNKKNQIIKKIEAMTDNDTIITLDNTDAPPTIIKHLTESLICKFSGISLTNQENKGYYSNSLTAIMGFNFDYDETSLRYNKLDNVFQIVTKNFGILGVGVNDSDYVENNETMIINITHPGRSLQKLKALS